MRLISRLQGQRVYVDANAFIFFVEAHPVFGARAKLAFDASDQGALTLVTSDMTLAEVLVVPLRSARMGLVLLYENLLAPKIGMESIMVSRPILRHSAELRASLGLKMIDAIHAATALAVGCAWFLSEDRAIRLPQGIQHVRVTDLTL